MSKLFKKLKKAVSGSGRAREPESRFGKSRPLTPEEVEAMGATVSEESKRRRYSRAGGRAAPVTVLSGSPGSDRLGP